MKLKLISLLLILTAWNQVFSQELSAYKGGYTFEGLRGVGEFTYYLTDKNEPILHGDFSFSYQAMDSSSQQNLMKLKVDGTFQDYKKDQTWIYAEEKHRIRILDVKNRELVGEIESKLLDWRANYDQGILNGPASFRERIWLGERYQDIFLTENLQFKKDFLSGRVEFRNLDPLDTYQIQGQVNGEGLMDGVWEFGYQEDGISIREIRRYEKGFLIGLQKVNELSGEKIDEVVFFQAISKLDQLNRGEKVDFTPSAQFFGLTFNDGFVEESKEYRQQYQGTRLLEDALKRILKWDESRFFSQGKLIKSPIQTRRFRYEVSDEDQKIYQNSIEAFEQLQSYLELIKSSDFLELNKNSEKSLAEAYAYLQYLDSRLNQMEKIIELLRTDEILYFDPLFFEEVQDEFFPDSIQLEYQFEEIAHSQVLDYTESAEAKKLSHALQAYLNNELSYFRSFDQKISESQQRFRQTKDLTGIQRAILKEKSKLDSSFIKSEATNSRHRQLMDQVYQNIGKKQYQELLDEFNQAVSFEAKAVQGDRLVELLQFLNRIPDDLEEASLLQEELKSLFTEKTFDPFTFETDFEVIRQKPVYEALLVLTEFELDQIQNASDFEDVEQNLVELNALKIQARKLRGLDTRKLERELNKAGKNINQIKKLLSL
ncbi:hypothetical protein [Algoriphagus sp. oki45]|uniref:hypothetical protein n=1 Tax=Algoriphagus sp. oki45 TaxID=3067294 RepID=UPI0030C6AFC5